MEKLWRLTRLPIFCTDCPKLKFCMENTTFLYTHKEQTNEWTYWWAYWWKLPRLLPADLKNHWEAWSLSSPSFTIDKNFCLDCPELKFFMKNKTLPYTYKKNTNERRMGILMKARALHPSKLDIGYCQKVGDIVNLKSGYWILPSEDGILGYWVHWNLDIGTLVSPQLFVFSAAGAAGTGY